MTYPSNDRGVAPVIGVIVMVIITILLAAVISFYVYGETKGLRDRVSFTKTITIKETGGNGVIDTEGMGYLYGGRITVGLVLGKMYDIRYFVDPSSQERIIYEIALNESVTDNPYKCVMIDGVCK